LDAYIKLAMLAVAIWAVIGYELCFYGGAESINKLGPMKSVVPTSEEEMPIAQDRSSETEAILARPMFQPDRRPLPQATASPKLGRLAGIVVSGTEKYLIFAGSSEGKPIAVKEGDHVDADIVQSISEDHATLAGPDGVRTITPSFNDIGTSPGRPPQARATDNKLAEEPESRMSRRK
jgi:hypothetical protein